MPQLLRFLSTIILFASTICRAPVAVCTCFIFRCYQLSLTIYAWIVTFCAWRCITVACICHALIFISDLASSFVLPENFVRIFEPVDIVDMSTFCLYVLPDIIVAIFSIATLYYTMRERSRIANSLELVDNTDHGQEENHGVEGGVLEDHSLLSKCSFCCCSRETATGLHQSFWNYGTILHYWLVVYRTYP